MYYGDCSTTCSSEMCNSTFSVELSCPLEDYRDILDRQIFGDIETQRLKGLALSERAHMLRKKWLPHRPKKVRWRKG